MRYIFDEWGKLRKLFVRKFVYLFLDYDGTLAPIAPSPEKAALSKKMKGLLVRLSAMPGLKIAIISGRSLKDLKRRVGSRNAVYVGNHGFEIKGPKIDFESPVSKRYTAALGKIRNGLRKKLSGIEGAFVEDKGVTLSAHYRLVDKKDIPLVKEILYETTILHEVRGDIAVRPGKMVLEVRPPVDWDKGKAALWLLARRKFFLKEERESGEILPVCLGDDVTDEDMFRAMKKRGLTVFVGRPRGSEADYYLKGTSDVYRFLTEVKKALEDEG